MSNIQFTGQATRQCEGAACFESIEIELPEWEELQEVSVIIDERTEEEGWVEGCCPSCARAQARAERGDHEFRGGRDAA